MIAHLDCDAFYATVELIRRPELKGKPVIVAGSGPRAVVTTASLRGAQVRRRLRDARLPRAAAVPDAVVIPPDFATYRETSKAVWAIVGDRLDRLQPMGLDEAYADLTGVPKPLRVLRELIEEVREARPGITISAGVGPSRLVAKCCSDHGKPAGLVAMGREEACERFATAPTSRVPGHRPQDRRPAGRAGPAHDRPAPARRRGGAGRPLRLAHGRVPEGARGVPRRLAGGDRARRRPSRAPARRPSTPTSATSASSSRCSSGSPGELCEGLVARGRRGRTIAIKVRLNDWTTVTRARSVEAPTNDVRAGHRDRAGAAARLRPAQAGAAARRAAWRASRTSWSRRARAAPPATGQLALPV